MSWISNRNEQDWRRNRQERLQLQIDEQQGTLISVEDVHDEWARFASACRAKLLALPTKMTMSIAAGSPEEIHGLLKTEVYAALNELADQ